MGMANVGMANTGMTRARDNWHGAATPRITGTPAASK